MRCKPVCRKGASCVESIPSKPQKSGAEYDERNIVNTVRSLLIAASSAKIYGEYEGAYAGTDMYDVAACKIYGADRRKEASLPPYHMRHRIVDDY